MDPLFSTVEYAMGGLQLRLDTIAHNVANVNTPLYRSQTVNFEDGLTSALRAGKPAPATAPQVRAGFDLVDHNGTSVSLENELTTLAKSSLERQVMVSSFNYKVDILKAAAGTAR
ncbi:MAG: flagellar basal body protein [Actinomycetia bacterium]|nr:flagellar basal body protein [Actinomycetes bacterium]